MCGLTWLSAVVFLRFAKRSGPVRRYLSDASYWTYIIHVLVAYTAPHLLWTTAVPTVVHYLLMTGFVLLFCLASYDTLVRDRWLGVLLNGRRAPAIAPRLGMGASVAILALGVYQAVNMAL